jgi:hypothetical protein
LGLFFTPGHHTGVFGTKGEKVAGVWTRLHNEELHNLYASPNIIKGKKGKK